MSGPYQTERQAADTVRHITSSPPGTGAWRDGSARLLEDACRAAGVELGAYDYRILLWLAGWEPATCAVIAGWVTRARAAELEHAPAARPAAAALARDQAETVLAALEEAAARRELRATSTCPDCAKHPAELCEDHAADLDQADRYRCLARQFGASAPAGPGHTCPVCGANLSAHAGREPCIQSTPSTARSLHDLPIFGWAWAEDGKQVER